MRRAYRILPPYYASALLFWGMTVALHAYPFALFGLLSPPTGAISLKGVFVCLTLINAYFNPSYWTLVLEARWYVLFPVLMVLWRRTNAALLMCCCALAAAAGLWLTSKSPRFLLLTGNLTPFLPIFACGIVVARWTAEQSTPGWLARHCRWGLLASVLLVGTTLPSDGGAGLLPPVLPWGFVAFFALIAALHDPALCAITRLPALVGVGAFSYSLYLIHEPFVHLAYGLFRQLPLSPAEQLLTYECGVLPFCIGLGYVFYRLVERPLVNRARLVFKRPPSPELAQPAQLDEASTSHQLIAAKDK